MGRAEEMLTDIKEATGVGKDRGGIDLNSWEEDFIDSIEERVEEGRSLTEKQMEALTKIWDRV